MYGMHPGEMYVKPDSHVKIDPSRPLVAQVRQLGGAYASWVHQPVGGVPRLFGPDWMEFFSKTPWYLVPIIWIPIACACMVCSYCVYRHTALQVAWRVLVGIPTWHLIEYSLHRFLFHIEPEKPWAVTTHFLLHGIHHKYPHDALRLVFPLLPASWVSMLLTALLRLFLPWSEFFPMAAGIILGYVAYDCTHYFVHHGVFRDNAWFGTLRQFHMDHHFKDHSRGFGISSSFFDHVFGSTSEAQLLTA